MVSTVLEVLSSLPGTCHFHISTSNILQYHYSLQKYYFNYIFLFYIKYTCHVYIQDFISTPYLPMFSSLTPSLLSFTKSEYFSFIFFPLTSLQPSHTVFSSVKFRDDDIIRDISVMRIWIYFTQKHSFMYSICMYCNRASQLNLHKL